MQVLFAKSLCLHEFYSGKICFISFHVNYQRKMTIGFGSRKMIVLRRRAHMFGKYFFYIFFFHLS